MAKLMVVGRVAHIQILTDPHDEELLLAKCVSHPGLEGCSWKHWRENFDTTDDAWAAAEQHADGAR